MALTLALLVVIGSVVSGRPDSCFAKLFFDVGVGVATFTYLFFTPCGVKGRQEVKPRRGSVVGHDGNLSQWHSKHDLFRTTRSQD